ncbi:hypothetical protein BJ742DRAFT_797208, partial [Cladochytrium replicatum]
MTTKHPWDYNSQTRGGNLPLRPMSELPPAYDGNNFGFQVPISQGPGPVVIRTQMMFTVRIGFVAAKPEVECTVQPGDVVYVDSISTDRPGFLLGYNVTVEGPAPKEGFKLLPSVCLTGVVAESAVSSDTPPRLPEAAVIANSPPQSVSTFDVVSSHPDGYLTRNVTATSQHRLLDSTPSMGSLSSSQNTHPHMYSQRSNDRLAQHTQQSGTYDSPSRRATANSPSRSRSVDSNHSREGHFDRNDPFSNSQDPGRYSRSATVGTPLHAPYPPPSQQYNSFSNKPPPQKERTKKLTRLHWILIIAAIIALGLLGVIAGVFLGRQTATAAEANSPGSNPGSSSSTSAAVGSASSLAPSGSPAASGGNGQTLPTTGRTTTTNAAATNAVSPTSPPAPASSPTAPAQLPCVSTPQEQFLCSGGVLYRCQNSFWTRTNGCRAEAERKSGGSTGFTFPQTCVEGQGTLASLPGQFGGTVVCPCAETKTAHCSGSHLFRCNGKSWFVFKQCENFNGRVCNTNTGNAAQCQGDTGD